MNVQGDIRAGASDKEAGEGTSLPLCDWDDMTLVCETDVVWAFFHNLFFFDLGL